MRPSPQVGDTVTPRCFTGDSDFGRFLRLTFGSDVAVEDMELVVAREFLFRGEDRLCLVVSLKDKPNMRNECWVSEDMLNVQNGFLGVFEYLRDFI